MILLKLGCFIQSEMNVWSFLRDFCDTYKTWYKWPHIDLRNAGVTCIRTVCFIECFNAMMILQFLHKLECSWEAKFSWQCFRMLSILYYIHDSFQF